MKIRYNERKKKKVSHTHTISQRYLHEKIKTLKKHFFVKKIVGMKDKKCMKSKQNDDTLSLDHMP